MIVLVPMGGPGSRFRDKGYTLTKPALPVIDRHTGVKIPMVLAALKDIPGIQDPGTRLICVNREEHVAIGLEAGILEHYPQAHFIHDQAQLGQAHACLLARDSLQTDEELIVACCDAGFDLDADRFRQAREGADVIMFSHSGDENIEHNPLAHSWAELNADGRTLKRISIKKTVSESFMSDHATTEIFWFRRASDFLARLEETLCGGSHPPEHYLVDHVLQSCVDSGSVVSYVDVRYYCWGTPRDYETYHLTYRYWETYVAGNKWLKS